jgi:hypothetical protein
VQLGPWPWRGGAGPANPASRRRSRPGKGPGWTTSSPRGGRGPEERQGGGRRRGPAAASSGGRGGQQRWPRRLGERRRGGEICGNKRTWEVHSCLVELLEQWDGGRRGRRAPSPGGGGNGGGGLGWRAGRRG